MSKRDAKAEGASPAVTRIPTGAQSLWREPSLQALDALTGDTLVLHLTSDTTPLVGAAGFLDWRLCGALSRMLIEGKVTARRGEKVLMPTFGKVPPQRILVFGWGSAASLADGAVERFASVMATLTAAKVRKASVILPEPASKIRDLVEVNVLQAMGSMLECVFVPEAVAHDRKSTRPIPAPEREET